MKEEASPIRVDKAGCRDIPANILVVLPRIVERRVPTTRTQPRREVGVSRWPPHKAHAVVVVARYLLRRDDPAANADFVEILTHVALHSLEKVGVPPRALHTRTLIKTYKALLWCKIYKRIFSYFFDLLFRNAELGVPIICSRKHMRRGSPCFTDDDLYPYDILGSDRAKEFDWLGEWLDPKFFFWILVELKINVRFYGVGVELHTAILDFCLIVVWLTKRLTTPFSRIAIMNTRVKSEFCCVILYFHKLHFRIVRIDGAFDEWLKPAPRPNIKMCVSTKRSNLKRPEWPHAALPSTIDGCRFSRGEIKRNERELHSARRFENIARHFHLKQNAVAPREIESLDVPYPRCIGCVVEASREPYRRKTNNPLERKEGEIGNLQIQN